MTKASWWSVVKIAWGVAKRLKQLEHTEQIDAVVAQVDALVKAQQQVGPPKVVPLPQPPTD